MKKAKALSLVAIPALAAGMLAGCGPKDEGNKTATDNKSASSSKELLVWEDKDKVNGIKDAVAQFEKDNNIKVKIKEIGTTDQVKQLRLDGPAGKGPDVITIPHDQIGGAVTEGLLAELKSDKSVTDKFTESSISAETFQGKLYGLPKATETPVFIYNKKLMPQDQVPKTLEDLYTFSKGFTKDGNYGFLALWDNFYFAEGIMAGYGGYVFENNNGTLDPTKLGLNNAGSVQGAEFITKWYKEGLFPKGIIGEKGGSQLDALFNEGKVAAVMNGPWAFQGYGNAKIDYGVAPMPKLANGQPVKTFMGVKGYHVTSFSKKQDLAQKFIEFITNEENSKKRFEATKEIPPVKTVIDSITDEASKAVAEQSKVAVPMPNIPEMGEVWTPAASALQLMINKGTAPQKALDDAVKQIETNIKTNHKK
ncbi:sugar ABC transporter substrate-binding protein [Ectobacillus ponti]|uniref:Extracellular solute-binding protein n=1 Tax=Ectobacillus ponti TaxID=2961894 RepID=A0AA41X7U8_9BACI|nr:extracellular solute-binding protein [Ectobacillus ponti]MCP8968269.1 extracellular solute-binding protein [Ectobacillus ponti]